MLLLIGFSLCANTYDEVFISGNSDNRLDIVFAQPENENPNLVKDGVDRPLLKNEMEDFLNH